VEKQEIPKPIWPLVLATIIWSLIVVFMGLPLTGGGHGPLTAIVVVTLAPVVFPLGLLFLSTSIINVARVGFFSFLALYAAAANLVILVAIVSNFQEIVDLDRFELSGDRRFRLIHVVVSRCLACSVVWRAIGPCLVCGWPMEGFEPGKKCLTPRSSGPSPAAGC
jgi:hypothetical protein